MYDNDMKDRKSSKGCVLDIANQIKQKSYEKQSNQILSFTMLYYAEARNELTGPIYLYVIALRQHRSFRKNVVAVASRWHLRPNRTLS